MRRFVTSLFGQVLIAAVAGITVGLLVPGFATELKPLSDGFLKLVKMTIAPLVFCVVVTGIAGAGDLRRVGRVGLKALIYFEVVTTIALVLGLVLAWAFGLGSGMNVNPATLDPSSLGTYEENADSLRDDGPVGFLLGLIPDNVIGAFAEGDVLQVLVFAVLFGCALALVGEKGAPVARAVDGLAEVLFKVIGLVVRLAPLGVLGAVAYTTGKYGTDSMVHLGSLVLAYFAAVAVFVFVLLAGVLRWAGFSLFQLLRYLREELLIVLGVSSSDSVLPQVMRKLENLGIKKSTVGLVIPTGYSFNLDAFSIYLTMAVVFIAQATGTALSLGTLLTVLLVALLTSKGAHGVPASAIVVLAATLSAIPAIPAAGLVLVLAVDWLIGMVRATGNLIGNCVATVVVAAWEGDIDRDRAKAVLSGEDPARDEHQEAPAPALAK